MNTRGTTKNNNNINQFDLCNANNTSEHQHPQPEHNTFSSISLPIMNPDSIPADHDWQRTLMSEEQEPILNRRQTVDSNHQSNMRGYHEIPSKNFSHPILKTSQYSAQTNLRNTLLNASAQFSGENNCPISNSSTEIESIQHQEEMFSNHDSSAASPTSTQLYPQETLLEMCRDLDLLMSDVSQIPDVVQGSNSTGFDSLPSSSVQQQQQPLLSSTLNNYFTNFGVDNETQLNEQQQQQPIFFLNTHEQHFSTNPMTISVSGLHSSLHSSSTKDLSSTPTDCSSLREQQRQGIEKASVLADTSRVTNAPIFTSHQPTSLSSFDESVGATLKSHARPSQLQSSSVLLVSAPMTSSNNHHEEGFASCADTVQESHQQVLSSSTEKRKHHHQRSSSSPIAIIRSSGSSPSSSPTTTTTTTNSTSTGNSSSSSNNHTDAPSSFPHKASHHHPHRKTRKPSPLLLHHQQQQQNSEMMFMNNMMSSTLINHHGSNNLLNPQTTTSLRNDFEAFHALGQSATSSMLFPSLNPSPSQGVVNMSSTNSNGSSHNDTTMNNDTIANMNDMHNMVMDPMTLASALLSGQINLTALNEEELNTLRLLISHPQQLSPQTQQQVGHSENYASNNMLFMNPNTQELVTNTTGIDSHMHVRRHSVASQMSLDSVYSPSMNNQKTFSSTLNVPSSNLFQESPTAATPQEGGHSLDPASSNMPSNATEIYSLIDNALSGCTSSLGLKLVSAVDASPPVNMNHSSIMTSSPNGRSRTLSSPAMYMSPNLSPSSSSMSCSSPQFLQVASNDSNSTSQMSPVSPHQSEPFNFSSFREQYQQQFSLSKSESSITALKGNSGKQHHQRHNSTPAITVTESKPRSRKKSIAKSSPASPLIHIPSIQIQGVESAATSVSTVTAAIPKRTRRNSMSSLDKDNSSVSGPLTKQNKMQNTLSKTIVFNNYYDEIQFKKKHGPNCTFYKFTEYK